MKPFFWRWFVSTVAVLVAVQLVPGITADGVGAVLLAALFLGIVNALVRPVLLLLSLPFILVTLGFFILVLNALLLWMVGVVPGFHIDGFWSAFWGGIVVSVVSWAVSAFFRGTDGKIYPLTHHARIKESQNRVIDV